MDTVQDPVTPATTPLTWSQAIAEACVALASAPTPPDPAQVAFAATLARDGDVHPEKDGTFSVRSAQKMTDGARSETYYTIAVDDGGTVTCSCPQGTYTDNVCKHRIARTLYMEATRLRAEPRPALSGGRPAAGVSESALPPADAPVPWETSTLPRLGAVESSVLPEPASPTIAALLERAQTSANSALPDSKERISAAVALVKHGAVIQNDQDVWDVQDNDPAQTLYPVTESCTCADWEGAPGHWCKHRIAVGLHKRIAQWMAGPSEREVPRRTPVDVRESGRAKSVSPLSSPSAPLAPRPPRVQGDETVALLTVPAIGLERSAAVGLLMGALARAQASMKNPGLDGTNPHFRSRFASLACIRDTVTPACAAEGIAITQLPSTPEAGWVAITTGLWHASGQYLLSTFAIPVTRLDPTSKKVVAAMDPQSYGSAVSYLRRYSLQAVLNIAGDDDDAEGAMRR